MILKNGRHPIFWLILIALIVRGATVLINMDSFNVDPDGYRCLAKNLQTEGVYGDGSTPTAFRPPLYPLLLRGVFFLTHPDSRPSFSETGDSSGWKFSLLLPENGGIALCHWGLGVLTVLLVYKLALLLTFPWVWAFVTALLVTFDPILLNQSRFVMTETLASFLAILAIYLLAFSMKLGNKPFVFLFLGLLLGASALCRPIFFVFAVFSFLVLMDYQMRKKLPNAVPGLFLLGVVLAVFPWGVRNYILFGKFIVTTTHGGYTFLLANNDFIYERNHHPGPFAGPWDAEEFHQFWEKKLSSDLAERAITPKTLAAELFQDELAKKLARQTISEDADSFIFATAIRIGSLWQFIPYQTDSDESTLVKIFRWGIGLFYATEFILFLIGAGYILAPLVSRRRRRRIISPYWSNWSWMFLLILAIQIPHLFYWTNMRMRAPIMTVIPILAVVGLRLVFNLFKQNSEPVVIGGFSDSLSYNEKPKKKRS